MPTLGAPPDPVHSFSHTFESIIDPVVQHLDGNDLGPPELNWGRMELDPWRSGFRADVDSRFDETIAKLGALPEPTPDEMHGLQNIVLPAATNKGDAVADRVAARRGVSPIGTGSGHVLDLAKTQLGVNYVWAASSPGSAFDCSGFTQWLYKRAYGVNLAHHAATQYTQLQKVEREKLAPGDLLFFDWGGGGIDHVEVYMGNNKMIGTGNTQDDLDIDTVPWENLVGGGRAEGVSPGHAAPKGGGVTDPLKTKVKSEPVMNDTSLVPSALTGDQSPQFSAVLQSLMMPEAMKRTIQTVGATPSFKGKDSDVKSELYQGFVDAGRPDLAKMVGTKDFQTWIGAESGWNVGSVSQYYSGHGRNYGLFQFWQGHDWTKQYVQGGQWTASPYEQARMVAKYFGHLTPDAISKYAAQVRAGDYHGWG